VAARYDILSLPIHYGQTLSEQIGIKNSNVNDRSSGLAAISPNGYSGLGDCGFIPRARQERRLSGRRQPVEPARRAQPQARRRIPQAEHRDVTECDAARQLHFQSGAADVLNAIDRDVSSHLPIRCRATEAWLMCSDEHGFWSRHEVFPFRQS
jgi:hypothetical protein